jgi:hypothetical protein
MSQLCRRARTWATARWRAARHDDRGVSVEQAIVIGLGAVAAVAVGTALVALVNQAIGQWQLW